MSFLIFAPIALVVLVSTFLLLASLVDVNLLGVGLFGLVIVICIVLGAAADEWLDARERRQAQEVVCPPASSLR